MKEEIQALLILLEEDLVKIRANDSLKLYKEIDSLCFCVETILFIHQAENIKDHSDGKLRSVLALLNETHSKLKSIEVK